MIFCGVNSASLTGLAGLTISQLSEEKPGLAIPSNRLITVNGSQVDEHDYVIHEDDEIWIVVDKGGQASK